MGDSHSASDRRQDADAGTSATKEPRRSKSKPDDIIGGKRGQKRSREEKKEAQKLKKLRKSTNHDIDDKHDASAEPEPTEVKIETIQRQNGGESSTEHATRKSLNVNTPNKRRKSNDIGTQNGSGKYVELPELLAIPSTEIEEFQRNNGIIISDPQNSTPLRPIMRFSHLSSAIFPDRSPFATFDAPTPIQAAAWPFLLDGRDVIGVAETGSGKTLAFGVPLVRSVRAQKAYTPPKTTIKALVVSPTRELAMQIYAQMESLIERLSLRAACIYGGVSKDDQRAALNSADIIVATPGRLNDLVEEGTIDLQFVRYLVLDEADRMLDKGFEDEIRKIMSCCSSAERQTLMFTATWPQSVRDLAANFMREPVHITIGLNNPSGELRANKSITQVVEVIEPANKQTRLIQLLRKHHGQKGTEGSRILIFALYKKEAARIEGFLRSRGFSVAAIHGDMSQPARTTSLEGFRSGACPLLVATDVAARGLDIPEVQVVINLTFPLTVEDYVHRIGRTGRAGKVGLAVTLFTEHDKALAGGLIHVLKGAGQDVPENLLRFGTTVKKKGHEAYGAFYRDTGAGEKKQGTKIRF